MVYQIYPHQYLHGSVNQKQDIDLRWGDGDFCLGNILRWVPNVNRHITRWQKYFLFQGKSIYFIEK